MNVDWNMVGACANVVIACTAVIAAWFALRQYRYSVRVQELEQILSMYNSVVDVRRRYPIKGDDEVNELGLEEVFILSEIHERLIASNLLSEAAVNFYRDSVALDLSDIRDPHLSVVRKILSGDPKSFRHIIATLKNSELTKHLTEG